MDSITQIALGSAVSEAVMQNKVGRKATLWGAILGTIPDLDVLIPMGDAVKDFTYHRAASHSLFFMTLAVPLILWIILKIHPATKKYWREWAALILLTFFTHALLDSFTVYGTQLFLPFSNYPVGLGSIFVIDPLYTIPLLLGVVSFFILKNKPNLSQKYNYLGLTISSLYLIWTVIMQNYVTTLAKDSLDNSQIEVSNILTTPSPFNTILWRVLGITDSGYVEGFYSLIDSDSKIKFFSYPSSNTISENIKNSWTVDRLKWFTKGFYKTELKDNLLVITDLRMGVEPIYFFSFSIGEYKDNGIEESVKKINPANFSFSNSMKLLWERIFDDENGYFQSTPDIISKE